MSLSIPPPAAGAIFVPDTGSTPRWFNGDLYEIKLTAADTNGSLGMVLASVPPGGGPPPHTHMNSDETFFLLDGQLEFLDGDQTFSAGPGDAVFLPRTRLHRFHNVGLRPAKMLFMYSPAGVEQLFVEAGEVPRPGEPVAAFDPSTITAELLEAAARLDTHVPDPS